MKKLVHNESQRRYELFEDDELASFAEYRTSGDRLAFYHTLTEPKFRRRGLAAEVVQWALEDVRKRRLRIEAECWFVADFVDDHPEYRDLVA